MFEKIISYSINNKILVGISLVLLMIWGALSLKSLPIDAIPDVTNNQVVILTQAPALAAEEIEQYVTSTVELKLSNLQGVKEIRSTSRLGLSVITVVFEEDIAPYLARQMVSEQLKAAEQDIPAVYGKPELAPITTGLGEIFQYTLKPKPGFESKFDLTELRTIQDWVVKRQLAGVSGVTEISSFGGYVKQFEVRINPERLQANDISISELYNALQANNANMGGSYIEKNEKAYFIRAEGIVKNIAEIGNIVIKNKGIPVLVKDVADVGIGHPVRYGAMTRDGEGEAVGAVVLMLKGADSEKTIKQVKARMATIEKSLPEGLEISAFIDRTKLIDKAIGTVQKNLIEGGLIVIFVLILLMGSIRAGILVASVIPITMIITFGIMNLAGLSANLMSLGALDFGLLVDCSVIVVEAVLFKLHHEKIYKVPLIGVKEMDQMVKTNASKVLSSAVFGGLIILLVYLPILSLEGIEGKMFKPMALTVSIAIVVAIILSMTYIPMASALWLRREGNKHFALSEKIIDGMYGKFRPLFMRSIANTKTVMTTAIAIFIGAILLFMSMGGEFIPTLDEGDLAVDFQTPPGSSLNTSVAATLKAQKALKKHFPEIIQIVGRIGASEVPTDPMPPEMADLMIQLKDRSEWTTASDREDMVEKMSAVLAEEVPEAKAEFSQPIQMRFNEMIAGARSEIVVKIFGEDLSVLASEAAKAEKLIRKIEGINSVKVERVEGLPQISIKYKPEMLARYGVTVDELNMLMNTSFSGQTAGQVYEKERRFDLVLRLANEYRTDIEQVRNIPVMLSSGNFVPFAQLAEISYSSGPAQISREDTKRRIHIGISVLNRDVESVVEDIQKTLDAQLALPVGYHLTYGGAFENLLQAKQRLMIAVPLALLLILVLLFFTFNSMKNALMIFSAIPLSAIGGILALWLRGMPFSISAGVGFIALFGVAVLNGIVLMAYLKDLEKNTDWSPIERVKEAVKVRFRPVIMTAAVASLGFLPMAISTSAGAEVQKPLATVVIGGLISATFLTLIVLPVIYLVFNEKRKTKIPAKLATALLLFISFSVMGQSNLPEILRKAEQNSQAMKIAEQYIAKSQAEVAANKPLQSTDFMFNIGNIQNPGIIDYSLGANQNIINKAKKQALNELFTAKIGEKEAEKLLKKRELYSTIRSIFYRLNYLHDQQADTRQMINVYNKIIESTSARAEAGEQSPADVLAMQLQKSKLENQLNKLFIHFDSELSILKDLCQESDLQAVFQHALYQKLENYSNPEMRLIQSQIQSAEKEVNLQLSQSKPDFNFGLYNQSFQRNWMQFYVGAGMSIPLDKSTLKAKSEAAKMQKSLFEQELTQKEAQINREVNALSIMLAGLEETISKYQDSLIPEAQKLIEKSSLRYQSGEITYMELQQYFFTASQLKEELSAAWYEYHTKAMMIQWYKGE